MVRINILTAFCLLCISLESNVYVDGFQLPQIAQQQQQQQRQHRRQYDFPSNSAAVRMARIEDEDNPSVIEEDTDKDNNTLPNKEQPQLSMQEQLDAFLDRPFFDPDAFDDDDQSMLGKFANLVKADYELAETIYVGVLFVVLIIGTQEVLRLQLYGDGYVPFGGHGKGRLF